MKRTQILVSFSLISVSLSLISVSFSLISVVKALMSVGGALISAALTIAALTSVVNSTDFSGTEHRRTDFSEFRAQTLVALTIGALKSVALTPSH